MSVLRKHVEEALSCINMRISAITCLPQCYDQQDQDSRVARLRELRIDRDLIKVALAGED